MSRKTVVSCFGLCSGLLNMYSNTTESSILKQFWTQIGRLARDCSTLKYFCFLLDCIKINLRSAHSQWKSLPLIFINWSTEQWRTPFFSNFVVVVLYQDHYNMCCVFFNENFYNDVQDNHSETYSSKTYTYSWNSAQNALFTRATFWQECFKVYRLLWVCFSLIINNIF